MSDALTFATDLLTRGIEFTLRGNRLWLWPGVAHKHLSDAEREFIRAHRAELKELVRQRALPEATVVWRAPKGDAADSGNAETGAVVTDPAAARAARDAALKEQDLDTWLVIHANEPEAKATRHAEARAEMLQALTRQRGGFPR